MLRRRPLPKTLAQRGRAIKYLLLIVSIFYAFNTSAMEIISHRGNCCGGSENSLIAIKRAWEAKADAVELDLRMSKDKIILLFHDEKIKGKTISSISYSEAYDLDNNIPELFSVLNAIVPSGYYIFDLKENSNDYLEVLSETIKNSKYPENKIAFQSDSIESLISLRERHPDSRYIYLSKLKRTAPFFDVTDPKEIKKYLIKHNINSISIKGRRFIDKEYIDILKAGNTSVFVWTINSIDRANYYAELGVNGIITDNVKDIKRANKLIQPTAKASAD